MIRNMLVCTVIFLLHQSKSDNPWVSVANHSAWETLSKFECGDSAADRIIGGNSASLGQFPWVARLGYMSLDDDEPDWRCGGALISDRHIVTAAHCIPPPGDEYNLTHVRLGEHNIVTDPDCQMKVCAPRVQDVRLKSIHKHQEFNKPRFRNDIALLVLVTPAELNDYVAPICLPREEQFGDLKIGEYLTVAGWGTTNMSTQERANILQFITLPVVNRQECSLGKGFTAAESEICAGAQHNKDACTGDSGGPLMKVFDTEEGPKNFLVGVVSFGPNICGIKKPGVYTSVTYFLKWILDSLLK